jgi:hypothetical protein
MIWNILRVPPEDRERIRELEDSAAFQALLTQQSNARVQAANAPPEQQ